MAKKPQQQSEAPISSLQPAILRRRLPPSPYVWRAVGFVERAYEEASDSPGAQHPFETAAILGPRRSEIILAVALLHDVLEDTDTTAASIRKGFGLSVSRMVQALTEDESIKHYGERKRTLRRAVRSSRAEAQLVFAADKLSKVRGISRSGKAPAKRRWKHYLDSHAMLKDSKVEPRLVNKLGREMTAVAQDLGLPRPD